MSPRRLLVATALIASTAVFAGAANRPPAVRGVNLETLPYRLDAWTGRDAEPLDAETLRILSADEYLNRTYVNDNAEDRTPINLYAAYYGRQRPGVSIHSPLHCLPGTGWEPLDIATITVPLAGGANAEMRRMLVRKNRDRAVVLYWYAIHGRLLASEVASKLWLLHDSVRMGRSDAALVRIVVPLGAVGDAAAAEQRGVAFARDVLPHLQHLWS
jgi:EpsI family protein